MENEIQLVLASNQLISLLLAMIDEIGNLSLAHLMKVTKVQHYKVIIEKDEDGYFVAAVPALPGCVTQAKTYEILIQRVREAIQLCLEVAADDKLYRSQQKKLSYEPVFIGIEDIAVRV